MDLKKYAKYAGIAAAVLVLAALLLLLPRKFNITVQDVLTFTPKSPLLAVLVLMAIYSMKSVVIGIPPLSVLYVSAGIMFPGFRAILVTYLGLICEMTIGYWIGRRLGKEHVEKLVAKSGKVAHLLAPTDSTFNSVCFIVRLVPGPLPLDIMSMLFGATKLSYGRYLMFSLLGVSPGVFAWVIAGRSISNPLSKEFLIPFGIGVGISLVAFAVMQIIEKKNALHGHSGGSSDA